MEIKQYLDFGMKIVWKKDFLIIFQSDDDKYKTENYLFKEGEISGILRSGKKKAISVGVEMTRSFLVFKYYTFTYREIQNLFDTGIIGFTY